MHQETLDPSFVAGFVHIEPGTPYDVEALLDLQRTLNETDYFSRVEVQAPRDAAGEDRRVPVTVRPTWDSGPCSSRPPIRSI